jgi:hypothetical protein
MGRWLDIARCASRLTRSGNDVRLLSWQYYEPIPAFVSPAGGVSPSHVSGTVETVEGDALPGPGGAQRDVPTLYFRIPCV